MTATPRSFAAALSGGPRSAVASVAVSGALMLALAAGCGNTAIPSPTPTPTATPTVRPAGSTGPTASPKADPAVAAVNGFVALVTKKGFSYQATFTGQSAHSTDIFPIRLGVLQVSGNDVLVRARWTLQGRRYTVEHRYVGGKGWIRYDTTDTWHRLAMHPDQTMAAFAFVRTKADVTYLGIVKSGGTTFYRVSFRSAIVNPVMVPAGNLTDTVVTSPKMTLLIDAAGRPVKGTAVIDGQGRVSGQLQEIVIDLTVAFTKVGRAVSIKAP